MKVISFSLWGTEPRYLVGMEKNVTLASRIYPGWFCRIYHSSEVPAATIERLRAQANVQLVPSDQQGSWASLHWRFDVAADPAVEVAIVRDADSRLNLREKAAVDAWLASGRAAHVMRDHPNHWAPMLGGMWGVRGGILPEISQALDRFGRPDRYDSDQRFQSDYVWPMIKRNCLQHDDYYARFPFPTRRRGREYVGQPFDEHDVPLLDGPTHLERQIRRAGRRVLEIVGVKTPIEPLFRK